MIKWLKSKFQKPKTEQTPTVSEGLTRCSDLSVPTLHSHVWLCHTLRVTNTGGQAWWSTFATEAEAYKAYKQLTEAYPQAHHVVRKERILDGRPGAVFEPRLNGYSD